MAPLPSFLFDTYKRYKADTNRVTAWLVSTAQKCGQTLEGEPINPSRPPGPRLKGKARKQARKTATTSATLQHNITVNGLLESAQLIASQEPPITVPKFIFGVLKSAISLRRQCANWFQTKSGAGGSLPQEFSTHSHFIEVLERIRQILEPALAPGAPDLSRQGTNPRAAKDVGAESQTEQNNPYDVLFPDDELDGSIEEPEMPVVQSTSRVQAAPATPRKVTYELKHTDEEVYFALFCFFDDLNRLCGFLNDLWSDYKAGLCDLITVSVTTNTAIELVHRAEQEFVAAFPKLDTCEKMQGVFYLLMCSLRKEDPAAREEPDDLFNFNMLDVAEWTFMPVHALITDFLDVIQPGFAPIMKPGYWGIYDPRADRNKLTVRERIVEDRVILLEALPEFYLICPDIMFNNPKYRLPVADEFIEGLRSVFQLQKTGKKDVPLWVAFGGQIFLDIHHILREDAARPQAELQASGVQAASVFKEYFATSKTFENWPKQNEENIRNIQRFSETWIETDWYGQMTQNMMQRAPYMPTPQPYSVLRRHPLLCGIFQFKLYLLLQDAGITLATAWGSIIYVCHLYHACRQGGYLKEAWPDMEKIMDIHTRESIFAGRVPQDLDESFKCFSIMLGASPENFARNVRSRPALLKKSKKGPRGLSTHSPVTSMFREQFLKNGNLTLTYESVEELLRDEGDAHFNGGESNDGAVVHRQWAKSHKLTVLQLLATLTDAMASEAAIIRFDYFSLHRRCLRLLKTIQTTLDHKFRQYFGPDYLENDTQLPFIVGWVFTVATFSKKAADEIKLRGVHSVMMQRVSEIMEDMIKKEGEVEMAKLEKEWEFDSEEQLLRFTQFRSEREELHHKLQQMELEDKS
jgi:hypothetical protein